MNYYNDYIQLLQSELLPALGCTEPIAIAYAAACAREILGQMPQKLIVECSGNIIKNVKGVIVPQSTGKRGAEVAAILGAAGGNAKKGLAVLENISKTAKDNAQKLLKLNMCTVSLLNTTHKLHLSVTAVANGDSAFVEIKGGHTNIVKKSFNDEILFFKDIDEPCAASQSDCKLNIVNIIEFAKNVELSHVEDIINRQIEYNSAIANEGLTGSYGACVGKTLLECFGFGVQARAKAMAAAGSDARMSGCTMPVIINSGSGNQGITVSLPVIEYAQELKCEHEKLIRALLVSNLCAIHQKNKIGRLSAYCGAVSAACGAGAGIAFLHNEDISVIQNTIINTLANVSGIVCDGAKPSCAAKIASSVDAAILGFHMAQRGRNFCNGEGLVKNDVEKTISCIGRLAQEGMCTTDAEILKLMLEQ